MTKPLCIFLLAFCAVVWCTIPSRAQTTVVDFDNPAPPGVSGDLLNGVFQGLNFGTGQWRWEGPFNVDTTNNIFFDSSVGTSRNFSFSPAPRFLLSMNVFTLTNGTLTLTDNLAQTFTRAITTGSMQHIVTNWTQASTTVTVNFTAGWDLGLDDITYSTVAPPGPSQIGQWSGVDAWPMAPVHLGLLRTGKVLAWDEATGGPAARLWNGDSPPTFIPVPTNSNIFCAGHATLADGRVLVVGGTDPNRGNFFGITDANIFDPGMQSWSRPAPMSSPRWYPTATTLPNGQVLVTTGDMGPRDNFALIPEVFNPATGTFSQLPASASQAIDLYPFMFVLPQPGLRVLSAGSDEANIPTRVLDLNAATWSVVDNRPDLSGGGSAVMYRPGVVMKSGTPGDVDLAAPINSTNETEILDMTAASPRWQSTAPMALPRAHHNLTLLPDGNVLVTGGERQTEGFDTSQAVYEAEIWNPTTQTWTTMAPMQRPRLYHSTAILLPDGRVLSTGGFFPPSYNEPTAEIFSPPYLFNGPRPNITSAPATLQYGNNFFVGTDTANISKVTLVRIGMVTHAFNQDQRFLSLSFSATPGGVTVTAPANANLAPPGYYLLFVVNSSGVPSIGSFVSLPAS